MLKHIIFPDNIALFILCGQFKDRFVVLANVAKLTLNNIREAQAPGIDIAVAQNKFKGRVKETITSDKDFLKKYDNVVKELKSGANSLPKIANLCDTSLSTVTRVKGILEKN